MPKAPTIPKSKKLPRKLRENSVSRAVAIMREATEKATEIAAGDIGDKITRAPKKAKR